MRKILILWKKKDSLENSILLLLIKKILWKIVDIFISTITLIRKKDSMAKQRKLLIVKPSLKKILLKHYLSTKNLNTNISITPKELIHQLIKNNWVQEPIKSRTILLKMKTENRNINFSDLHKLDLKIILTVNKKVTPS